MSWLFGNTQSLPREEQKLSGVDKHQPATSERARPLPYVAGIARVGVTWLTDTWGERADPIEKEVEKEEVVVGHRYFASFGALVCLGPVDEVRKIFFDAEEVWDGPVSKSGDSTVITIPERGDVTIYWGTETQTADATMETGTGNAHPGYRGQCYLVFDDILLGKDKEQAPNVEVIVGRWPQPPFLGSEYKIGDDINPVVPLWEWWADSRFGLGRNTNELETTKLQDTAKTLSEEGLGISPKITDFDSWGRWMTRLLEYIDGYSRYANDGDFYVGLMRSWIGVPVDLDEDDLIEPPTLQPEDWSDTYTKTELKYSNAAQDLKEDNIVYHDEANFNIQGRQRPQTLERPWLTQESIARKVAGATGRRAALPQLRGKLRARKPSANAINPGDQFLISYGDNNIDNIAFRCIAKRFPATDAPTIELKYELDRSYLNVDPVSIADEAIYLDQFISAAANPYEDILEAPYGLANTERPVLAPLASRANKVTLGFNVHLRREYEQVNEGTSSYVLIGTTSEFAQRGHVITDYPDNTTLIDRLVGLEVELDSVDNTLENLALDDAMANRKLVIVGGEIMSLISVESIGTDQYRLTCIRRRYDTPKQIHAVNAEIWIIDRLSLLAITDGSLNYQQDVAVKLQPFLRNDQLDLASVNPMTHTINGRALTPIAPLNLRANNDGVNPTYATGEDVPLTWHITTERRQGFYELWGNPWDDELADTILEFRTTGGTVKRTETISPGTNNYTYSNADLQSDFGGEPDFIIRAYHKRGVFQSSEFDELTIYSV